MSKERLEAFKVKGYTSPRSFSGFQIPVPLQSLAIRRYCEDRNYVFNHHVSENISQGTFLVLERIVAEAHHYQAVAMCSIGQLPLDATHRSMIVTRSIDAGISLHFVFEQLVVSCIKDIEALNSLLILSSLVPHTPEQFASLSRLIL